MKLQPLFELLESWNDPEQGQFELHFPEGFNKRTCMGISFDEKILFL